MKKVKNGYDMVKLIYGDLITPRITVGAQTICDSDKREYESILRGIASIGHYNNFEGHRTAVFIGESVTAVGGCIIGFRFGREYSPVLYLTIAHALGPDFVRMSPRERRLTTQVVLKSTARLEPDSAKIIAPGEIRLWWD